MAINTSVEMVMLSIVSDIDGRRSGIASNARNDSMKIPNL